MEPCRACCHSLVLPGTEVAGCRQMLSCVKGVGHINKSHCHGQIPAVMMAFVFLFATKVFIKFSQENLPSLRGGELWLLPPVSSENFL